MFVDIFWVLVLSVLIWEVSVVNCDCVELVFVVSGLSCVRMLLI